MGAGDRKTYIKELLKRDKKVSVAELAVHFDVTEETVRRDLQKLENEGFVQKVYGGAVLNETSNVDLPFSVRRLSSVEAKQKIAEVAATIITEGTNLMLDASSTALFVIKALKDIKSLTVITNSSEIVCELSDKPEWRIFATGGQLKEGGYAFVGARTVESIKSFHADTAIFSCKGIDPEFGLTDSNDNDAEIKKAIIKSAKRKILAVDNTKFDHVSLVEIGSIEKIDAVITNKDPGETWKTYFDEMGIDLYY